MRDTRGREALVKALKDRGWSQGDLARELEVAPGVVSRWARGERVPELESALAIAKVLAIAPELWTEDPADASGPPTDPGSRAA